MSRSRAAELLHAWPANSATDLALLLVERVLEEPEAGRVRAILPERQDDLAFEGVFTFAKVELQLVELAQDFLH